MKEAWGAELRGGAEESRRHRARSSTATARWAARRDSDAASGGASRQLAATGVPVHRPAIVIRVMGRHDDRRRWDGAGSGGSRLRGVMMTGGGGMARGRADLTLGTAAPPATVAPAMVVVLLHSCLRQRRAVTSLCESEFVLHDEIRGESGTLLAHAHGPTGAN